jgi:hypothetical protein
MERKTIFFPLQMIRYFEKVKKKTGLPMASQIRAIIQAHMDKNPL